MLPAAKKQSCSFPPKVHEVQNMHNSANLRTLGMSFYTFGPKTVIVQQDEEPSPAV